MVPITALAFLLAKFSLTITHVTNFAFGWYDAFGLLITGAGVCMINLFTEKKQKASIEDDF
tara:strand:- start:78 stop:260 length:183 start_codon:yes stop_codon:yes gene_type:complete